MKDKFKAEPLHLIPIVASLVVAFLCTFLIMNSTVGLYTVVPFPEGVGSLGNGLYFVILALIGASLLYLLLRRRNLRLITIITGFALTVAVFLVSDVYAYALFSLYPNPYDIYLALIVAVALTVLADFQIFRRNSKGTVTTVLLLGAALGAFLGITIPLLSGILILSFLAIYDVYAVYRGPVGKIASSGLEQFRGLSVSFRDVQIGLGDLTFYSMLTSMVLINAGFIFYAASVIGVIFGSFFSFKLLEKKGMFPGLPFSVALGLAPLIFWFILQ